MNNYPAGAEHDLNAPYNERVEKSNECKECNNELESCSSSEYCEPCRDYLEREKLKSLALNKLQQSRQHAELIQDCFGTTDNIWATEIAYKILVSLDEAIELIKSIN